MAAQKPFILEIPSRDILPSLCKLGVFGTGSVVYLLWGIERQISSALSMCCNCPDAPSYIYTLAILLSIVGLALLASTLQAVYLNHHYVTLDDSRPKALSWLIGQALLQSFPFVLMVMSLFALPDYQAVYFFSGLSAWVLWFVWQSTERAYQPYKLVYRDDPLAWLLDQMKTKSFYFLLLVSWIIYQIILPACACTCRSKLSSVKANMHTFQTMLETYAVDSGGVYPSSIQELKTEAQKKQYWKTMSNPCTSKTDTEHTVAAAESAQFLHSRDLWGFRFELKPGNYRCTVLYRFVSPIRYEITGTDLGGGLIIDKGKPLILSND